MPTAKKGTSKKPAAKAARKKAAAKPRAKSAAPKSSAVKGDGTKAKPWVLKTPSGSSEIKAYRDETADPPALVVLAGGAEVRYRLQAIDDLHEMLHEHGDWIPLGTTDEQKEAPAGTVEAWARSADNPVGGWYGLKKGLRGRFGNYVPPVLEALGMAEVEHNPRNNRMRAI
jgi:hypothetical protein